MKENDIDKVEEEEIVTKSNPEPMLLDKNIQIEDSQESSKTFECQVINQGSLNRINIIINLNQKTIEIKMLLNNKNRVILLTQTVNPLQIQNLICLH